MLHRHSRRQLKERERFIKDVPYHERYGHITQQSIVELEIDGCPRWHVVRRIGRFIVETARVMYQGTQLDILHGERETTSYLQGLGTVLGP